MQGFNFKVFKTNPETNFKYSLTIYNVNKDKWFPAYVNSSAVGAGGERAGGRIFVKSGPAV